MFTYKLSKSPEFIYFVTFLKIFTSLFLFNTLTTSCHILYVRSNELLTLYCNVCIISSVIPIGKACNYSLRISSAKDPLAQCFTKLNGTLKPQNGFTARLKWSLNFHKAKGNLFVENIIAVGSIYQFQFKLNQKWCAKRIFRYWFLMSRFIT